MKIAPIDIAHKTFNRKVMGLDPDEVTDFLRDCESTLGHLEDPSLGEPDAVSLRDGANVAIEWQLPDEPIAVAIDRQMLRRVLANLVRNSVQAIRDSRARHFSTQASRIAPPSTESERPGMPMRKRPLGNACRSRGSVTQNIRNSLCTARPPTH